MKQKIITVLGFIFILIAAVIGKEIGKEIGKNVYVPNKPTQQQIDVEVIRGLEQAAKEYGEKLPIMLDEETRLDKVYVGPGVQANFNHTLISTSSRDVDSTLLNTALKPLIVERVCATEKVTKVLKLGAVFVYSYFGNDGIKIIEIPIIKTDCGLD